MGEIAVFRRSAMITFCEAYSIGKETPPSA